ncbi:MAG: Lrp/AsnC family transcriptional regulator [Deltaproteobacteria bacterium]|jgi:Lrp/AsnC family leucine-responsive transcriptional regulator|nr:Lrp/AsnC family transcriptional regulator [Deltaproteobacteria bacterium]
MKCGGEQFELDQIDLQILASLQEHGRIPVVKLAEQVGLSAPSVVERIKKLEDGGIITGYHASLDAKKLGQDVTAFIGVSIADAKKISSFEATVPTLDDVLECHHVTGQHTMLLKVRTRDTSSLEELIRTVRLIEGVARTETMVVLSTHTERTQLAIRPGAGREGAEARRHRHSARNGLGEPKKV